MSRIVAAPFIAGAVMHDQFAVAAGGTHAVAPNNVQANTRVPVFIAAGVCDGLDGWLARRWNQTVRTAVVSSSLADRTLQSKIGALLDPLSDKLLVGTTAAALYASVRAPWSKALRY